MKAMKKIILVILVLPILLLIVSLFLPSQYHVERVTVIKAPPEAIYPWLVQLRKWPEWTVWNTSMDRTLVYNYTGSAEGVGEEMSWTAKSGNGALKLTVADAKTGVKYDMNFDSGKFICRGGVVMVAEAGGTRVTFFNEGEFGKNPVVRYFGLFMDKMMGGDFEKNLASLKQKVEPKLN
jgi:hypothetical protein